jgi:predicted RecA/RadA family phage recombinase
MSDIRRGDGKVIQIVAPGNLTTGVPILTGSIFGVPVATVSTGGNAALEVDGVQALPKSGVAAVNFALGAKVYWNEGTKLATATATDVLVGECIVAAGNTATSVQTRIYGRGIEAVDADAVAAAGLGTLASLTTTDKASAVAAINEIDAAYKADIAALAKLKSGTVTIAAGQSVGTAAMGAATWDGKPVVVSIRSSAGAIAAAVPQFEAAVAAGTLTVTSVDKDGVATNCTAEVVLSYIADGR